MMPGCTAWHGELTAFEGRSSVSTTMGFWFSNKALTAMTAVHSNSARQAQANTVAIASTTRRSQDPLRSGLLHCCHSCDISKSSDKRLAVLNGYDDGTGRICQGGFRNGTQTCGGRDIEFCTPNCQIAHRGKRRRCDRLK